MDSTLNLNATECLARTSELGSTVIYNICNGNRSVVPWGSADWALAGGLGLVFGVMLMLLAAMAFRMVFDW